MKKILFSLSLLLIMPGCAQGSSSSPSSEVTRENWQEKISILDQSITRKKNLSDLYRAKATRAKNQGDRLQFNPNNVGDARRYWNVADYYNEQADLLDQQVVVLQQERQRILEKYGE
ncbi:MAG: hypothetical protein SNF33_01320 [Candidatus Algichlamydia australiensis]|nr:hypothetical protein [Chlamydiales bacterium]